LREEKRWQGLIDAGVSERFVWISKEARMSGRRKVISDLRVNDSAQPGAGVALGRQAETRNSDPWNFGSCGYPLFPPMPRTLSDPTFQIRAFIESAFSESASGGQDSQNPT
jgi:hypothetical protein